MLKVTSGVYVILNNLTGKLYIGCSKNVENRLKSHKRHLKKGSHVNRHLQNAVNKDGLEKFTFKLIHKANCEEHDLLNLETLFIRSESPDNLYNIFVPDSYHSHSKNYQEFQERKVAKWRETVDRNGGLPAHSEDRKKSQSKAVSGDKNGFFGKHHTPGTKQILSEKAKERWKSPEEKELQSQRRRKFFDDPANRAKVGESSRGRRQTEAANQRKSILNSGSGNPNATAFVLNGVKYGSFKEAEQILVISKYKLKKLLKPNDYLEKE